MAAALEGIRVVDLTSAIAGPFATLILRSLGADVVKLERIEGGDDTRKWGPPFWGGESATFLSLNSGKHSLAIDAGCARGREIVHRLVERADVFIQSLRPGTAERMGFGFDALQALNPRLIHCDITSYGTTGPLADRPGYDPLMQAAAGLMSLTGEQDRPPVRPAFSYVDQATGMWSVIGILTALRERERDGRGRHVDTSLYETALGWLMYPIAGYLATGEVPMRQGSGISILAPSRVFETADGWAMITAANDRFFARLCAELGIPAEDRFATNSLRLANRDALDELIAERTRTLPTDELVDRLQRAGVPVAPVLDVGEVVAHPQTEAIGIINPVEHPAIEGLRLLDLPLNLDGERAAPGGHPPLLGEHTDATLAELGYDAEAIRALRADGVVG